jgi:hypothetical protein
MVNGKEEYMVEKILDKYCRKYGRGYQLDYLVK